MRAQYLKILGFSLIILGTIIIICASALTDFLIPFIRNSISADGVISDAGMITIHRAISFLGILILFSGILTFSLSTREIRQYLENVFLRDKLASYSGFFEPKKIFLSATIISIVFSFLYFLFIVRNNKTLTPLYAEDGFFENMTAVLFFISSWLIVSALCKYRKTADQLFNKKYLSYFLILASLGCFFIAMEEISWGQRIFGIETPKTIAQTNYQQELNIHNYFNPVLKYLYLALIPGLLVPVCFSIWLNGRNKDFLPTWSLILPHPALILMIVIICADTILLDNGELIEELLSVMSVFYAMRIRNVLLSSM